MGLNGNRLVLVTTVVGGSDQFWEFGGVMVGF